MNWTNMTNKKTSDDRSSDAYSLKEVEVTQDDNPQDNPVVAKGLKVIAF